jgi:hypothetical protein
MSTRNDPNRQTPAKRRSQAAERQGHAGDAEQATRRSQGVFAPRAEPSRQGAKRHGGGRR